MQFPRNHQESKTLPPDFGGPAKAPNSPRISVRCFWPTGPKCKKMPAGPKLQKMHRRGEKGRNMPRRAGTFEIHVFWVPRIKKIMEIPSHELPGTFLGGFWAPWGHQVRFLMIFGSPMKPQGSPNGAQNLQKVGKNEAWNLVISERGFGCYFGAFGEGK